MVPHEELKAKLKGEFERLGILEDSEQDQITAMLNQLSQFIIETYGNRKPARRTTNN